MMNKPNGGMSMMSLLVKQIKMGLQAMCVCAEAGHIVQHHSV